MSWLKNVREKVYDRVEWKIRVLALVCRHACNEENFVLLAKVLATQKALCGFYFLNIFNMQLSSPYTKNYFSIPNGNFFIFYLFCFDVLYYVKDVND